ncbi:dTDP-4-dehydrorhamnose reductase [Qipengyuania sp. XHP0211]|uniref:dTDP-4-dehydrorhamnose reductase n=1 Tax=Qipengyuania sp. XHP0211 TaxID=3038079 RepID=UPI00241EA822|nr:dTDP-4-dehydrorhamnose reductase [Qipengyuania sp. XHP0211]MDG5750961.1 dTDP-4-dehydrorhamnose reductase [Qipengyuania sp. XHP0211]
MILVFGQSGQVARELARLPIEARFLSRAEADFADPSACAALVAGLDDVEAVINAVAYTAVDQAEEEEGIAHVVNADTPGAIAAACARRDIPIVHISTDYVFSGEGDHPFSPSDSIAPLNAYGRTKAEGERLVRESGAVHGILRTSWVFSAHGGNFVKSMLRLAETRDRLAIVDDQVGGPTPASAIAEAAVRMAKVLVDHPGKSGTYHFSGTPDASWAVFAREIFAEAGREVTVEDIPTSDYPTPARRPLNSRLDCSRLAEFDLERPDWREALRGVLKELDAQ